MSNWKSWQQFAFLGYLLLLNVIVLGTLAYLVFSRELLPLPQSVPDSVGVLPSVSAAVITPSPSQIELTPAEPAVNLSGDRETIVTATPIPPIHILPVPPPGQPEAKIAALSSPISQELTVTASAPLVEAQVQPAATNTPTPWPTKTSTPFPSPTPTETLQPTATPTSTPQSTATFTSTPQPTATSTHTPTYTPQPTTTSSSTPTHTPMPTVTFTNTPQPTVTSTRTPHPTATSTPLPTATPTSTLRPSDTPTRTGTPTPRPVMTPTLTPSSTPQQVAVAPPMPTATLTSTPRPTVTSRATATSSPTLTPSYTPSPTPVAVQEPPPVAVAALITADTPGQPAQTTAGKADLVKAIPLTNDSIALNWPAPAKNARYRIYSDMGSGYGIYVYKAETGEPTYIDEDLRPGMAYNYRVTYLQTGQEIVLAQTHIATFGNQNANSANLAWQAQAATLRVTPAPTALPPDAILLGLRSENNFTDNFNILTIVGEVRNDSNVDVGQTDITVTFYDAAGATIGTANGQTMFDVLPPGEISPFIITLTRPSALASYSLRAVARPVTPQRTAQLSVIEVKRYEDEAGFFHVKGVIENVGNVTAKRTKVAAIIYGRDNRVINVNFTYVSPPTLSPGQRATYDVIFTYYPRYVTQKVIPFEE